jgi:hypothetical protein
MRSTAQALSVIAILLAAGSAQAGWHWHPSPSEQSRGHMLGLNLTLGEGVVFAGGEAYRGPLSLEVVPSIGVYHVRFDLGFYMTFEDLEIASTSAGYWNFTLRPGVRVFAPVAPLYFRLAFPLVFGQPDFDWGVMLGLGADIPLGPVVGLVLEMDTTLTKNLEWGGAAVPLEFRIGVSFRL